jgi:DNA-binding CsgD family transcriptional regulator
MQDVARRVSSVRFIGRAEPIELFDDVLTEVGIGHGQLLLIAGEAGVGKSRLVDELADRALSDGTQVLRGWCIENGGDVMPLAPIADLLRDIVGRATRPELEDIMGQGVEILARLVPDLDPDGQLPPESPLSVAALSDGVLRALHGLSERCPVLVVLEDLHWSDASTRQFLAFLAPRLSRHRVMLIATYRTDELHRRHPLRPFLVSLRRAVRPEQIELVPFTRDELAELVAGITGTTPAPRAVDRLHERCAGNAFFAEELLAGDVSGRPSALLRDAVLSRTDGLNEEAMTVLRATAAAGSRVMLPVLADACRLSSDNVERAADAIIAAGLFVRDVDGIRFRHELAREIVLDELLTTGDRTGVHAALASALQSLTPHRKGEIAMHWMKAGDQSAALEASVAAGRAAVEVAADAEALTQFERALDLWDRVTDPAACAGCDHWELLLDAADAAGRARMFGRASALGRKGVVETAQNNPPAEGIACLRVVPWAWFNDDDPDVRLLIDRAAAVIAEEPPAGRTALVLAWQALLEVSTFAYTPAGAAAARSTAARAVELARAGGNLQARVHAETTLGVCTCIGRDPAGLGEIRTALDEAKRCGFAEEAGRAYDSLSFYLEAFGRHDDVIELEQEALDYCAAAGIYRVHGVMVQLRVIRSLLRTGRWQSVEQRVERLRAEFGTLDVEHLTLADCWGLILVRQGRLDGVQDMVDDTFARLGGHPSVVGPVTVTAIELQAALGNVAPIPDLVESALDRIPSGLPEFAAAVVAAGAGALADLSAHARTAAGHQDVVACRRRVDTWIARVRSAGPADVPPWMVLAEAERTRLDDEPSEQAWTAAVDAWRKMDAPYESAYTQWRLADAMLKGPNRQSVSTRAGARTLLMDARKAAVRLGADPLTGRIDTLAARAHLSLDLPRAPRAPDEATAEDRLGLTEREREVLRLVAEGYSNGQIGQTLFISRKTASVHVSNILRKLGVSSRLEAATLAVRPRT